MDKRRGKTHIVAMWTIVLAEGPRAISEKHMWQGTQGRNEKLSFEPCPPLPSGQQWTSMSLHRLYFSLLCKGRKDGAKDGPLPIGLHKQKKTRQMQMKRKGCAHTSCLSILS